jgi:FMN phosphatase YigB (HAD superfamily)
MTFLFDIGRVLLDFDFESALAKLLPPDCPNPAARMARLLDRKDEFETGAIPPDQYVAWALDVLGSDASPEMFCDTWQRIFTPNQPMWDQVDALAAAGHRLILFSNTNGIHCPWIFREFDGFDRFHHAVLSYEIGSVKPDPAFYRHAMATHRLVPAETFYIDDLPPNIATGQQFGFNCHLYDLRNHQAFENWLSSFDL